MVDHLCGWGAKPMAPASPLVSQVSPYPYRPEMQCVQPAVEFFKKENMVACDLLYIILFMIFVSLLI